MKKRVYLSSARALRRAAQSAKTRMVGGQIGQPVPDVWFLSGRWGPSTTASRSKQSSAASFTRGASTMAANIVGMAIIANAPSMMLIAASSVTTLAMMRKAT